MKIKNVLIENGYTTDNISEEILNYEIVGDAKVNTTDYFYNGFEISYLNFMVGINLDEPKYTDDSEFTPFVLFEFDEDSYIVCEKGYDEKLNLIYTNEC